MLLLFYLFIFQSTSNRGSLRAYYIVRIDLNLCQVFLTIPILGTSNGGSYSCNKYLNTLFNEDYFFGIRIMVPIILQVIAL